MSTGYTVVGTIASEDGQGAAETVQVVAAWGPKSMPVALRVFRSNDCLRIDLGTSQAKRLARYLLEASCDSGALDRLNKTEIFDDGASEIDGALVAFGAPASSDLQF